MTRRLLAIAVLLILAVSAIGRLDAFAATAGHDSADAVITDGAAVTIGDSIVADLKATSLWTDCSGCPRCGESVCSPDALGAMGTGQPSLHRQAELRMAFERLDKTALAPGLRPPIPVS